MKPILFLVSLLLSFVCNGQQAKPNDSYLSISPIINQADKTNQVIIASLADFLKTKNASLTENNNWSASDFQRYVYPYLDIYNIEASKYGKDFYRPTLMEIIPTESANQKVLKVAFIGHVAETGENQIRSIYNLLAHVNEGKVIFSRYLEYATKNWQAISKGSLIYKVSPNKAANEAEIDQQLQDVKSICTFFNCAPIPITYYSCVSPKEVFEIKGFDYNPMIYVDKTGGLADYGNLIYSGNGSEVYTHEIVHIYTGKLFPKINKFIDEGLATYIAGSGKFDYEWHRSKLAKFLSENTAFDFAAHTDPYERVYHEEETSIPYMTAALILERTMRLYGKEELIGLLKSETELWATLKRVGLTKENMNKELRAQIKLPLTRIR